MTDEIDDMFLNLTEQFVKCMKELNNKLVQEFIDDLRWYRNTGYGINFSLNDLIETWNKRLIWHE